MNTYTPGPWELNARAVSHLHNGDIIAQSFSRPLAECEANARLIAAAPDLLQACKAMLTEMINAAERDELDTDGLEIIRQAQDAITKAQGQP